MKDYSYFFTRNLLQTIAGVKQYRILCSTRVN